jgi:Ca2+-binding RTX toxin-like protein
MKKRVLLLLTLVVLGVVLVVGVALAANFTGTAGPNRITGTGSADNLDGGGGADILIGAEGPDNLFAAFGVDALRGGKGNDLLVTFDFGGGDTASGGDGQDTCVIDQGDNVASCEDINPEVTVDQP